MSYEDDTLTPLFGKFDIQGAQQRKENRKSNLEEEMLHEGRHRWKIWRVPEPVIEFATISKLFASNSSIHFSLESKDTCDESL